VAGRGTGLDRLRAFAVEDRSIQLTWGRLDPMVSHVRVGDDERDVSGAIAGGAVTFDGLEPDRDHTVTVSATGRTVDELTVHTLPSPPGRELFRFATVSDIHIGIDYFDLFHRMRETLAEGEDPHPIRCTRAAVRELSAWGAQRLVVKGDLTEESLAEEWAGAGAVMGTAAVPVDVLTGNHDHLTDTGGVDPEVGARLAGAELRRRVEQLDLPGFRLVYVETPIDDHHSGRLPDDIVAATAEALRGAPAAVVVMHHQLQTTPLPLYWPPGVPFRQSRRFLSAVAEANPRTLITSGHTHRHRRHDLGPLVATEVGSPKDYPGTWAGYVVHEGGIRQVVRRIEAPDCIEWLERTRRAAFGTWGHWSPGRLEDRCFTHRWPADR
jgi:predicted phosphodiesterase